jgi:hypothetical protein
MTFDDDEGGGKPGSPSGGTNEMEQGRRYNKWRTDKACVPEIMDVGAQFCLLWRKHSARTISFFFQEPFLPGGSPNVLRLSARPAAAGVAAPYLLGLWHYMKTQAPSIHFSFSWSLPSRWLARFALLLYNPPSRPPLAGIHI